MGTWRFFGGSTDCVGLRGTPPPFSIPGLRGTPPPFSIPGLRGEGVSRTAIFNRLFSVGYFLEVILRRNPHSNLQIPYTYLQPIDEFYRFTFTHSLH
jgi:hypothetical protein